MKIRPFDETIDKSKVVEVLDRVLKYENPALGIDEDMFNTALKFQSDQSIPSRDFLVAEDNDGKIIGFAGLLKSSKRDFWRVGCDVLPEYFKSNIFVELFQSILHLKNEQNGPEIRFSFKQYKLTDSPLQKKLNEMGLKPVHYNWEMFLEETAPPPQIKVPPNITIQTGKEIPDFASYVKVHNEAFSEHFGFRPYSEQEFKVILEEAWKAYDNEHWFAYDGKNLVGICTSQVNPELKTIGLIQILGVLPSYQHQGIGRCLLASSIQSLIEKGCKKIELGVEANNEKALTLYKNVGFKEEETRTLMVYKL